LVSSWNRAACGDDEPAKGHERDKNDDDIVDFEGSRGEKARKPTRHDSGAGVSEAKWDYNSSKATGQTSHGSRPSSLKNTNRED
jgi:hypothetical protein